MKVLNLLTVCISLFVCYGSRVEAASVQRNLIGDAVANCQPALPTFDGNIRKRPMAFANEGDTTAFITCGSEQHNGDGRIFEVYFVNRSGSPNVVVHCSLVDGFVNRGVFLPRTSEPIALGGQGWLQWTADDNSGISFVSPTLSCALPPGVDIVGTAYTFVEYVGN
jgi:hypothetical protein